MTTQTPDEGGLLAVADELYGLALPEFTPTRDARAKELKAADAGLAARVKALRKPSMAAWVVNLLVRHESEQVAQVLQVGAALREAQASLAGEELRALTRQRRQLTAAVTTRARALAAEHGQKVTPAVSDQVEATLTAAMVDEDCAAAVRSGMLVAALATTGVGAAGARHRGRGAGGARLQRHPAAGRARGPAGPARRTRPGRRAEGDGRRAGAAGAGRGAATRATEALAAAAADVAELEARSLQVQSEIDELRRRLAALETRFEEVDDELADAEDVRSEAESSVAAATRDRDAASAALDRLGRR